MSDVTRFFVFFAVWLALGIACAVFFYGPFDVQLKKRAWPVVTIVSAVLFGAFVWWQFAPGPPPWFLLVVLPVFVWFNIKAARFCQACGAFQQQFIRAPWQSIRPPSHCRKCGAMID